IASLPATICAFAGSTSGWWYEYVFSTSSALYAFAYFLLIIGFSYFYAAVQYNPIEIANNLKKNGGFIPGFRPGKPTADFIGRTINKIVVFGAMFLAVVALMPIIVGNLFATSLSVGGTSVIIVVGVALETVNTLEAQMMMRHYKGFLD
ncbi:MAG: SecY family transport protein, partial [Eubacteriales bacterium]